MKKEEEEEEEEEYRKHTKKKGWIFTTFWSRDYIKNETITLIMNGEKGNTILIIINDYKYC